MIDAPDAVTVERPEAGPWALIERSTGRVVYHPRDRRRQARLELTLPSGALLIHDLHAGLVLRTTYFASFDWQRSQPIGRALGDRATVKRQQAGATWFRVSTQEVYDEADTLVEATVRLVEQYVGTEAVRTAELPRNANAGQGSAI